MDDLKRCSKCEEWKPRAEFYRNKKAKDGLARWCKECNRAAVKKWNQENRDRRREYDREYYQNNKDRKREYKREWDQNNTDRRRERHLLRKYGLTLEMYNELLAAQGGVCAYCGTSDPGGRGAFHVDHDHSCCPGEKTCGECINGLLCSTCNIGLGHYVKFANDPRTMRYLHNPPARSALYERSEGPRAA